MRWSTIDFTSYSPSSNTAISVWSVIAFVGSPQSWFTERNVEAYCFSPSIRVVIDRVLAAITAVPRDDIACTRALLVGFVSNKLGK